MLRLVWFSLGHGSCFLVDKMRTRKVAIPPPTRPSRTGLVLRDGG